LGGNSGGQLNSNYFGNAFARHVAKNSPVPTPDVIEHIIRFENSSSDEAKEEVITDRDVLCGVLEFPDLIGKCRCPRVGIDSPAPVNQTIYGEPQLTSASD